MSPIQQLAKLLEESGAILTLDGVPVERLREQARAEDATYEHSIAGARMSETWYRRGWFWMGFNAAFLMERAFDGKVVGVAIHGACVIVGLFVLYAANNRRAV